MTSKTNLFDDPNRAGLETTAGEARADAQSPRVARQVEANANLEHHAAEQAASVAKTLGPKFTGEKSTSIDKPRGQPPADTPLDQAVEEGKRDVADVKATGAGYIEQAKEMATKATATAQGYISSAIGQQKGTQESRSTESSATFVPSVQGATTTVMNAASGTLESAKAAAQNVANTVTATAQGILGTAGTQGAQVKDTPASSTGIPSTSAPLEAGSKKVDTPYPSTTSTVGTKDIGQNQPMKDIN